MSSYSDEIHRGFREQGRAAQNVGPIEVPSTETPRGALLAEASALITGDRNKTYGSPTENFRNTADIWNALLGHKLKPGEKVTATEVATLMIGLKLARTIAQPKRDNFVDMAGYAACGWETQEAETASAPTDFPNELPENYKQCRETLGPDRCMRAEGHAGGHV